MVATGFFLVASTGESRYTQTMQIKKVQGKVAIQLLKERLIAVAHLGYALGLLSWDQEVKMPARGGSVRARVIGELSLLAHQQFLALNDDGLLATAEKYVATRHATDEEGVIVRETRKDYDKCQRIPAALVKEMSEVESHAQAAWEKARAQSDYSLFAPWLAKVIAHRQQYARLMDATKAPYDVLLDDHVPGLTTATAATLFESLKPELIALTQKIRTAKCKHTPKILRGNFPIEEQKKFFAFVVEKMGYELAAGRIDESTHPFTMGLHPEDTRITTRYHADDLLAGLRNVLHETGHALYSQGLLLEHYGTPMGDALALDVHESQSRLWEYVIGASIPFWKYLYPHLQKRFPKPFQKIPFSSFYAAMNCVTPSLVRIDADEVTYNLHIILRFELERALIEGSLAVHDLPAAWNAKMWDYLHVRVPNDRLGVLQDVHWSHGSFGYFPSYTIGNLYAAQWYAAMHAQIPGLERKMTQGQWGVVREWLRTHIHEHGRRYSAHELVQRVTGAPLSSTHFLTYLRDKYKAIYHF